MTTNTKTTMTIGFPRLVMECPAPETRAFGEESQEHADLLCALRHLVPRRTKAEHDRAASAILGDIRRA